MFLGEQRGQRRDDGVLIGEAVRIGIMVGAIATQFGQRQLAHERAGGIAQEGIVTEDSKPVARQMHVRFDAGDAGIESGLERWQGVFRMHGAGAAMALQVERRGHRLDPQR